MSIFRTVMASPSSNISEKNAKLSAGVTSFVPGNTVDGVMLYGVSKLSDQNGVYSCSGMPSAAAKDCRPCGNRTDALLAVQLTIALTLLK